MADAAFETDRFDYQQETERLAALNATGILDTPPEASYDTITRLAGEYFRAVSAVLTFGDEGRVWVKSCWGQQVRELPRKDSIFDMVLEADGPVLVPDISLLPQFKGPRLLFKQLRVVSFAAVPVRSSDGKIIGTLDLFFSELREAMTPDQLQMLQNLADMASSQLELRRLQKIGRAHV